MAQQQTITGVRGLTSKTWYPRPPVEWGRAGGAIDAAATTTDGGGSALKVDLAVGGDVVTAITVDAAAANDGNGYRIGDKITVSATDASTATPVVGYVTSLEYED